MGIVIEEQAAGLGEVFAFLGNSLMKPPTQEGSWAIEEGFWEEFPDFGDAEVREAASALAAFVRELADSCDIDPVTDASVEYARLFIGPPKPAAAPWETMYRAEGTNVGFGAATYEMREVLSAAGLQLENQNNQYEDHMGIELLYLSVLLERLAEGERVDPAQIADFIDAHPGGWIDGFRRAVSASAPGGYYEHLLGVAVALLAAVRRAAA